MSGEPEAHPQFSYEYASCPGEGIKYFSNRRLHISEEVINIMHSLRVILARNSDVRNTAETDGNAATNPSHTPRADNVFHPFTAVSEISSELIYVTLGFYPFIFLCSSRQPTAFVAVAFPDQISSNLVLCMMLVLEIFGLGLIYVM